MPKSRAEDFSAIESAVHHVLCDLSCADATLNNTLDHELDDRELRARAECTVHRCVKELEQIRARIDSFNVHHLTILRKLQAVAS